MTAQIAPLTRHSSAAEVVLSYLRDQVAAIAHYDSLVRRDEPDAVHQMRVATRRARSAPGHSRQVRPGRLGGQ
jgi:CHAD domain-containing protein